MSPPESSSSPLSGSSRAVDSSGRSAPVDSQWRMFGCISSPARKPSLDDGLSHFHRRYSERGPSSSLRVPPRTESDRSVLLPPRRPDGKRRFDDWINHLVPHGNTVRTIGHDQQQQQQQQQQQWRQPSNEVRVAPLARVEDDDLPRPGLRVPPSRRNNMPIFQETRRNDYGAVYVENSRPSDMGRLQHMNVVFLQAHDEVKRAILPTDISSLYQVKIAFVRAFPNINRQFLEQPQVKIYIQEPSKSQLFYELEDPRDITDKAVLRLRDNSGSISPMPFAGDNEYHSEAEVDDERRCRQLIAARPASAMAEFMPHKPPQRRRFDDDGSQSSVTRSGSTTPVIIDRESRERMETMERQLAGLSSLVHSALVSKGMNERTQKDMDHLRREILALHCDGRESSEEPPSLPESLSSHTQHQLQGISLAVEQTKSDVRQLRRQAQINAQSARSLLKEAADEITRIVVSHKSGSSAAPTASSASTTSDKLLNEESETHSKKVTNLLCNLTELESAVENVRSGVLNNNKKLRMSEVEQLTVRLARLGGEAAQLKESFDPLQTKIEEAVKEYMEKVLRNEKFIKEQNSAVDQSLRRCKALANIMVTMKKLAMVQDPSIQRTKEEKSERPRVHSIPQTPPDVPQIDSVVYPADPAAERPAVFVPTPQRATAAVLPPIPTTVEQPPPVPPLPSNYISPVAGLDSVLEEVGNPSQPPRPPSRFSVQDVRSKFTKLPELPEQLRSIIEDVVQRSSPQPERDVITERRQELEQRQERLVEKQRQLRNQFMQLQQIGSSQP